MLKALAHDNSGRPVAVLGLSKMNIAKLKQGLPIHFDMQESLGVDLKCIIFFGKTEDDMQKMFTKGMMRGEISIGKIKRDKPLSLREELIEATEGLLETVGDLHDKRNVSGGTYQSEELDSAITRTRKALKDMKPEGS